MKILGICHDVLICSACLIENGEIRMAISEERLDRRKQSRIFPERAIARCLLESGLGWEDIDEVAIAWNPAIDAETTPGGFLDSRRWRAEHLMQVPSRMLRMAGQKAGNWTQQRDLWEGAPPITYVEHYLAHLGNAVFLSPYEECAVLVLDGRAEKMTGLLGTARGAHLEILEEMEFPHSLGLLYGAVTQFLGFRPDSDEWKVMALAAFSEGDNPFLEKMRSLIRVDARGRLRLSLEELAFYNFWDSRMYSDEFVDLFGEPRQKNAPLEACHKQIAAALQTVFEEVVTRILEILHQRTGMDKVVVTGGCFMNSAFNGKITQVSPFLECFITSCPDDSGTSVGAALYLHALRMGQRPPEAPLHNFWGPGFSDAECWEAVQKAKLPGARILENPAQQAARDLNDGKLLGWFQGRAEFGQRALGGRSILADPRRGEMKDIVNAAVKFREGFRPFAPAILAERVADYFQCEPDTRVAFMERVLPFRPEKIQEVPAVAHEDGTGRVQTVDGNSPARYREVLVEFEKLTGVPVVLNTSFNLNGEPMVNSPEDAIRTFYSCGLDILYLGNVRITKSPSDA